MQLFKTPHIQFLKYKYIALAVTAAIVVAGVLNVTAFKGLKLGVDFGEGTLLRIMTKAPATEGQIRDLLQTVGLGKSQVQRTGDTGRDFRIRALVPANTRASEQDQHEAREKLPDKIIAALRGDDGQAERARKSCACTTCHVVVRTGYDSLDPPEEKEEDLLDKAWGLEATSRLSCQAKMRDSDLVVEIPRYTINYAREGGSG